MQILAPIADVAEGERCVLGDERRNVVAVQPRADDAVPQDLALVRGDGLRRLQADRYEQGDRQVRPDEGALEQPEEALGRRRRAGVLLGSRWAGRRGGRWPVPRKPRARVLSLSSWNASNRKARVRSSVQGREAVLLALPSQEAEGQRRGLRVIGLPLVSPSRRSSMWVGSRVTFASAM